MKENDRWSFSFTFSLLCYSMIHRVGMVAQFTVFIGMLASFTPAGTQGIALPFGPGGGGMSGAGGGGGASGAFEGSGGGGGATTSIGTGSINNYKRK